MDVRAFSDLLLMLNRTAGTVPVRRFRDTALEALANRLPFDAAAWLTATVSNGRHQVHGWRHRGLPEGFAQSINERPEQDTLGGLAITHPGQTLLFNHGRIPTAGLMRDLTQQVGATHVLCTGLRNEAMDTFNVLAVARRDPANPFTEDERQFKQLVMPHLEAFAAANFESQAFKARLGSLAGTIGIAFIDDDAAVLEAEAGFFRLMRLEWPQWSGQQFSAVTTPALKKGRTRLLLKYLSLHLIPQTDCTLVVATERSPTDLLTDKELVVAEQFARGLSHKEIARTLCLSPETIRTRLRVIYEKLEVSDRGKLAERLLLARQIRSVALTEALR